MAKSEPAERMACRVVRDPVREVRADVYHPEAANEELGQLQHSRGKNFDLLAEFRVIELGGEIGIKLAYCRNARCRRGNDEVLVREHPDEATSQIRSCVLITRVEMELSAARLRFGKLHLVTQPLNELYRRDPDIGKQRVVHAGEEEGDAHECRS